MAPAFPSEEIERRQRALARALGERGLDALLCFAPESRYWLGDERPDAGLGCVLIDADGGAVVLTAAPEPGIVSPLECRPWPGAAVDEAGHEAMAPLRALLGERGLRGARIGVEYDTPGLSGDDARRLDAALTGEYALADAGALVARKRAHKSPLEMACLRRAAGLADAALDAAVASAGPGAWAGDLLAEMQAAVLRGGGEYASRPFGIACGADPSAGAGGRARVATPDRIELSWTGVYRRYHAPMARTLLVADGGVEAHPLHAVAAEALTACIEACVPGASGGDLFDAQARVLEGADRAAPRRAICGHGVGALVAPTAAEWPLLEPGSDAVLAAGMALCLRVSVDDDSGYPPVTIAQTVEVSEAGAVPLHRYGLEALTV